MKDQDENFAQKIRLVESRTNQIIDEIPPIEKSKWLDHLFESKTL